MNRHSLRTSAASLLALGVVGLVLAACSSSERDTSSAAPAPAPPATTEKSAATGQAVADEDSDHEETPQGAAEHDDAQPRLLVADTASGAVEILDLATGETVATLDLGAPASLAPSESGRFVYAGQYDHGAVKLLDAGSWVVDHGDHVHYYTSDPAVTASVGGPQPAHLVSHDDVGAFFFDGRGEVALIDEEALARGQVWLLPSLTTGKPHHGVAVPFAGHYAVTLPARNAEAGALPGGVQIMHDDGDVEARFANCPELHGEAGTDDAVVFACANGLLTVSGTEGAWEARKARYPKVGGGDGRAWTLTATSDGSAVYGVVGDRGILGYRPGAETIEAFELPATVFEIAVDEESGLLLALTVDGQLHHVDPTSGESVVSEQVVQPFEIDFEQPLPALAVASSRAYVSDPAAGVVVEVALNDDLRVARTLDPDVTPGSIAVAGA